MFDQPPLYAKVPASDATYDNVQSDDKQMAHRGARASRASQRPKYDLQDYSNCFHISLAWSLSQPSETDTQILLKLDVARLKEMMITFDSVKAKIGNHVSSLSLSMIHN
jgi:hypothetical protein